MSGGRDVEQKGFSIDRKNQNWGFRQKQLDHVKCLLGHGHPFEVVGLLQKSIKGETSFTKA